MSKIARRRRRRNGGLLRFSHHRRPVSREVRRAIAEDNRDRPLYLGWQPKDFEALAPLGLPKPRKRITQFGAGTDHIGGPCEWEGRPRALDQLLAQLSVL